MAQLKAMFLIPLLASMLAVAPLPLASSPLKVAQIDLRIYPDSAGEMRNAFQIPQHFQDGDRMALSVTGLMVESGSEAFGNGKWSWEVRYSQEQNKIILETAGRSLKGYVILKVSIINICKRWEEKVIFLQNLKITPSTAIKQLENGYLLTTSSSKKFTINDKADPWDKEVFILYRGFEAMEDASKAILSIKSYLIENEHIHIDTQMLGFASCQITLMLIDHSKLAERQIKMVHVSLTDIPSQTQLTLPNIQLSFRNCFSKLSAESRQQCWLISPRQRLQFEMIVNQTQDSNTHYLEEVVLDQTSKVQVYSDYGRERLLSSCSSQTSFCTCSQTQYPNSLTCYQDSSCICRIRSCVAGYYLISNTCKVCPTNLTRCTNCALQFGTTNVTCTACSSGYTVLNKVCVACPIGCTTCTTTLVNSISTVTCSTCTATLALQNSGSIKICGCAINQFLNRTATPVVCVTCPATCLTCTSSTVCTACAVGSYLSGTACSTCLPICKTCTTGNSCSTCFSTATVVPGGICNCPSLLFFDINTKTCRSCTTLRPNCKTCDYSNGTSYSPVLCITPSPGFRISSGSAVACVSYCTNCNAFPTPFCTTCNTNFEPSGSTCICNTSVPLYFSTTQDTCIPCATIIPGCQTCNSNPIPSATNCQICLSGYFAASYPTLTCSACPNICSTCISTAVCQSCVNNLSLINNSTCVCGLGFYISPTTLSCEACSIAIFGCQTCSNTTSPVTCTTAIPGFYVGTGGTSCFPCNDTCSSCSSSAICTVCDQGYTLTNGTCICDTACQNCLSLSNNSCSSCNNSGAFVCITCAVGFFNNGAGSCSSCTLIDPNCADCTNTTCNTCNANFILSPSGCSCNNTQGLYLSSNGLSCQACSTIIPNCQQCTAVNLTTNCITAVMGYYVQNATACLPCGGKCLTCSGSATHCLTCLATYALLLPNKCDCDNANNQYYNQLTGGCTLCTAIIPNCQTCSTIGNFTICSTCLSSRYWNNSTSSCEACSPFCTACSSPTVCTSCPNNLVLSQVASYAIPGACVCDNRTLPFTYQDSASGTCQPCQYFFTTCTSCYLNGTTVSCGATTGSTYLVAGQVVNCPSPCSTCDASGCLSCPVGMDLTNGSCVCGSACTSCESLSVGCVNCTISAGAVTSCLQCLPGKYLSSPDCLSCPSTCTTCTSSTVCQTCQPSYVLVDNMCSCPLSLGIFPSSAGVCNSCSTIFYACSECQVVSGSTACVTCESGYFSQGGACSTCDESCVTCSGTATTCTSCAPGQTLTAGGACVCISPDCIACEALSPNCVTCVYTIHGNFSQCGTCAPDHFLNGSTCTPCPASCQSCGTYGLCLTCPNTFENIRGNCVCNAAKEMWKSSGTCTSCSSMYSNCIACVQNTTNALNVSCSVCQANYYLLASGTCTSSVCGDRLITSGEACDDGNTVSGDGCSSFCQIQQNFACTGQPSACTVSINFYITPSSIITNKVICNRFDISFTMYPAYTSYDTANFNNMFSYSTEGGITLKDSSYSGGVVTYTFDYSVSLNNRTIKFYFSPALLAVTETSKIPVIVVSVPMYPNNNVQLIYYLQSICKNKQNVQMIVQAVEYASYGTLIASALPCKIVGLELFGVLQMAHINVGNMDNVNTMMTPLMGMKGVHGFSLNFGQDKKRLLQTSYTPSRVQSIGYQSNFLRNCNLMLMIVMIVILVSTVLYLLTWICQKFAPCLHSISKRIIKEVLLTLILFNCFNFAYSAGLHFNYAPKDDSLYTAGTIAAILALIIPLMMAIGLMYAEDDGFGEYKEKFKEGLINRLYFVVTILYRTGIGLYISTANEDSMSTLIVMALSIAFLLYNLVNLPYNKAYHNYRANICHFTQFICLFVAMYYRSMMSSNPSSTTANVFSPAYLLTIAILISLIVSVLVLIYEIYLFVLDCFKGNQEDREKHRATRISDESYQANEKQITEGNLESFTNEKKISFDSDI